MKKQRFITDADEKFIRNTFGVSWHALTDKVLTWCYNEYVLDVIILDKILHQKHGYQEHLHGSMVDFITQKWGVTASVTVTRLICPMDNYLPAIIDK